MIHGSKIAAALVVVLVSLPSTAASAQPFSLVGEDGCATEEALEALLSPGEHEERRFVHESAGDEAAFAVDLNLGAQEPFARLVPGRLRWPLVFGLPLVIDDGELRLEPASDLVVDDDDLDDGFEVRWILAAVGQRFAPKPVFEMRVTAAEVLRARDGRVLLRWSEPEPPPRCVVSTSRRSPSCRIFGLGKEARSIAMSPDGRLISLAFGGLEPRLEVWDNAKEPRLAWRAGFPPEAGGIVETTFSADGRWVVALTGNGRMHRFDAASGGLHLAIPSKGRTARAISPGKVVAVAGESGEITLWYLRDGTIRWRLPPRKLRGPVDRIAASADGRRLATLEYDADKALVRVWDTERRALAAEIEVDAGTVFDIALDEEGRRLFVSNLEDGLHAADLKDGTTRATAVRIGAAAGAQCRGRLQWISGLRALGCAVPRGVIHLDERGTKVDELDTEVTSADWLVTAAQGGDRIAAIGEGVLLVWWRGSSR